MNSTTALVSCCLSSWLCIVGGLAAQEPTHDAAFWQQYLAKDAMAPAAAAMAPLMHELVDLLGNRDPQLRDDIAYSLLTNWIYRERAASPELLRDVLHTLEHNLELGIGTAGDDRVLRRSFSALTLGMLVALDNEAPYLEPAEFAELLRAAITYLGAERDVRGHDDKLGWMHSVAHTADLLKFLGRSRRLTVPMQRQVLAAIAAKLDNTPTALTHGEDERLARAVLPLCARDDFDQAAFARWLTALTAASEAATSEAELAKMFNRRHLVVSLYAVLMTDRRESKSMLAARAAVLDALR